jgi:hypothetical protein
MRRLRDQGDSSDPAVVRAAEILTCASPLDAERFWNRPLPARGTSRPPPLHLRTAAVLAMSFASLVASAAMLPHLHVWDVSWATTRAVTGPQASTVPVSPPPRPLAVAAPVASPPAGVTPIALPSRPSVASVLPRPAAVGQVAAPLLATAAAPAAANGAIAIVQPALALPRPEVAGTAPGIAAPVDARATALVPENPARIPSRATPALADSESSLIIDAVRALRRDRDPARALSLAEVAMDRYPQGAQIEEAMALGMEAAKAAGDGAAARRLAERYLASFRTGHFADRAQQILSTPLR